MPALLLLAAALGLNYSRHRHGKSTICSTSRRVIGPRATLAVAAGFLGWFVPHYYLPFFRAAVQAFDDNRPEIEENP